MENSVEEHTPEQPIEQAVTQQQLPSKKSVRFSYLRFLKPSFWSIFFTVVVFTSLLAVYYMFAITDNFLFVILFEVLVFVISLFLLLLFIKFIKKIYNIFGLMLAVAVAGIIILVLIIFELYGYSGLPASPILDSPPLGSLVIIIGLMLYVLYLYIRAETNRKFYLAIAIISGLSVFAYNIMHDYWVFRYFPLIGFLTPILFILMGILFIIIGLALYTLYLSNRTDKNKKTYGEKFIIRGIATIIINILIIIFYGITAFVGCAMTSCVRR